MCAREKRKIERSENHTNPPVYTQIPATSKLVFFDHGADGAAITLDVLGFVVEGELVMINFFAPTLFFFVIAVYLVRHKDSIARWRGRIPVAMKAR